MWEAITSTFNTSVMAVTQLLLSTVVSSNPWFDLVQIEIPEVGNSIMCTARLEQSFTKSLDDVLLSGETITLHFTFEILDDASNEVIHSHEVIRGFRYTVLDDRYYVLRSEHGKLEGFAALDEAKASYTSVNGLSICPLDQLDHRRQYRLRVRAFLDAVQLPEMTDTVNLMLLWVSTKPTYLSDAFNVSSA